MIYSDALARVHAEMFAPAFDGAADWLAELASGQPVFDIGCGDGRMLALLAERGVFGRGVDVSPAFVKRARARGLDVALGDAANLSIPQGTGLILALGEVLSYANGDTALAATCLPRLASVPRGTRLVFDVIGPEAPLSGGWKDGDGWVVTARSHRSGDVLTREIVTFAHTEDGWRRQDEIHKQITLTEPQIKKMLADAGFKATFHTCFGRAELLPGRLGVFATKL